jgi:hypothetical protein
MPEFERVTEVTVPAATLAQYHSRPGAFERLAPTWEQIEVVDSSGTIRDGDTLHFRLRKGPLWLHWRAVHSDYIKGEQFRDTAVQSPFSHWSHVHRFEGNDAAESSTLRDSVEWTLPLHPLSLIAAPLVNRLLDRMFDQRHMRTANDLAVQRRYDLTPQRIAITGGTGMIGTALTAFLKNAGHDVSVITRSPDPDDPLSIGWNPRDGKLDSSRLEGMDTIIHLAGAGIADERWTDERKRIILESRTLSTTLLSETLAGLSKKPSLFISASAVGFYGDQDSTHVDESSPAGTGFLADVCSAWESAAAPARKAGIRVVHPRLGVVIAGAGGALKKMLPAFQLGAGGRLGDGKQGMAWTSLDDVVYSFYHIIATESLDGPVNIVSPAPLTNAEFTKQLGKAIHRPTIVPVPAFAIKTLFGEMGEAALLEGSLVEPSKLRTSGYQWTHSSLVEAVRFELGKS